jgi:hypothetical protein
MQTNGTENGGKYDFGRLIELKWKAEEKDAVGVCVIDVQLQDKSRGKKEEGQRRRRKVVSSNQGK